MKAMQLTMALTVTMALASCVPAEEQSTGIWLDNLPDARKIALQEKRPILIDFTGSDWCGWCIKLDKEVFSTKVFQAYAKDNLVLMLADFPSDKSKQSEEVQKQNEQMKNDFPIRGFPTVFILSPDGKTVAKTGYQDGGPEAYVEHIKKLIAEAK